MATMKAVRINSYGGPEVLVYEYAPRPTPGESQVLIRVHAAGVNPLDWKTREGYLTSTAVPLAALTAWQALFELRTVGAVFLIVGVVLSQLY